MEHGGQAARQTTVESTNLGMAAAFHGGDVVHLTTDTFHGQLGAAVARRASFEPTAAAYLLNSAELARHVRAAVPVALFHRESGPPAGVLLVGPQLPGGVVLVDDNYCGYSALQPRLDAGLGVVHPDNVAAVYNEDNSLQRGPGAGHGEVLVDLLPVPDNVGHGEVFTSLLPGGYDNYGYYALQPRSGAGHDKLVGMVFNNSGNFAQQALPTTGVLADDLRAVYDLRGMVAEHLRRLLSFAGIVASSVAVNGLATSPGSPAVAFHLFVLFLGGLFLVILHVLRV